MEGAEKVPESLPSSLHDNSVQWKAMLCQLLAGPEIPFATLMPSHLPSHTGIYAIRAIDSLPSEFLRAGRTDVSLRSRIYGQHLMGDQEGNLRNQLVVAGISSNMAAAKTWIRHNCTVQWLEIEDSETRRWMEYYMLSILRPRFCD